MSAPANPTDSIEPHILAKLDPDFVKYYVDVLSKNPPAQALTIDKVRANPELFRAPIAIDTTGWERVSDYTVKSEDAAEIPVRVYHPDPVVHGDGPYPVHLNFHGGGFVLGDLMSEAQLCLSMRDGAGVVVIDVNYRHCPETIWGKCVQDAWAALLWARDSAGNLKLNPESVSIGGVSAGAHIALILQHMARDAGITLKLCMASVTPSTEGFLYKFYTESPFPSFHEFYRGPILPWARIQWFGKYCMPQDKLTELQSMWPDWWFAPLKAKNWSGLCDTYIRTAECDILRDEGEAYGMKLVAGGNKVTFKRYMGSPHTFMYLDCMRQKHAFDEDAIVALKAAHESGLELGYVCAKASGVHFYSSPRLTSQPQCAFVQPLHQQPPKAHWRPPTHHRSLADTIGSEPEKLRVAIVGGGICGLALAAGLCKIPHLDVHVYEAVPEYRDVGAGLALHLNAIKAMASIGPEVRHAYFDKATSMGGYGEEIVTEVILAQGPHMGERVAELGRAKGRQSVSRADLIAGFLDLVPKGRVLFDKKLTRIVESPDHQSVHLEFGDHKVEVDCLLGADGIHSLVRPYLLGKNHPAASPKNHDGWQVYRTLVTVEEAKKHINEKWTRNVPILLGPKGHINCIPLNKGTRLSAGVAVRGAALATEGGCRPLDPELYKDYSEEAQQIVRMVARDTSASWSVGDHDHAPFYHKNHVAMVGDAAHASLPFAGNGAAQALEDAAVLNHLFRYVSKKEQIRPALAAYEMARRGRSQEITDLARRFGRLYAYAEDSMHEDPERMKAFFAIAASYANDFDIEHQNKMALTFYELLAY